MSQTFEYRLTIQSNQKSWVYTIPIRPEPVVIGRQPGSDILLEHKEVSRRHAELVCSATECTLKDLNSANGTRLNGQKLTPEVPVTLKSGDSIQVGGFNLDFEQIPVEEPAAPNIDGIPEPAPRPEAVANIGSPEAPPPLPPDLPLVLPAPRFDPSQPPPGLTYRSERLLSYLPVIYHTDFMANFLAIFESILFPIEWQIDGFDLFLDPGTAPASFLPWLANWFNFIFDSTWTEAQRRTFLKEAYSIYSRSGTRWALLRILEIYCGPGFEVDDQAEDLQPYTFRVKVPRKNAVDQKYIERLIDAHKPTHTDYVIELVE
jgi:phage tail-like protein